MEFELCAWFVGPRGFKLVAAIGRVPICTHAGIHLTGMVVSFLSRTTMACLPASLHLRVASWIPPSPGTCSGRGVGQTSGLTHTGAVWGILGPDD